MYRRSLTYFFRTLVSLMAVGYLLVHPGVSPAAAAQLTPQQISQFLANPSALLAEHPNGGGRLVSRIRDLLLSDPATLPAIIALLANANDAQQSAIGSGLGQAARALANNPALTNQIQTALAGSGSKLAVASYSLTTGNVQIGAAGGGGVGGGGPVNGGAPGGSGGGGGAGQGGSTGTGSGGGLGLSGGGSVTGPSSNTGAPVSPI